MFATPQDSSAFQSRLIAIDSPEREKKQKPIHGGDVVGMEFIDVWKTAPLKFNIDTQK